MIENYSEPVVDLSVIDECKEQLEKEIQQLSVAVKDDNEDPDIDSLGLEFSY